MKPLPPTTVRIEKLRRATDHRGFVFEPLDDPQFAAQRNAHVVITYPGEIRGNHFHTVGTEITSVNGPTRVCVKERDALVTHDIPEGETWRFTFPPHVTHAFLNTGDRASVIVSFNTEPHDPQQPDVTRDVILERV